MPHDLGKLLMQLGLLLVVVGLLIHFGGKFLPFGHLPGDIHVEGKHGSFYFPLMTSIVLSIVLSVLAHLFR